MFLNQILIDINPNKKPKQGKKAMVLVRFILINSKIFFPYIILYEKNSLCNAIAHWAMNTRVEVSEVDWK